LKKYKFDNQLQFLKPHLQERDTMGNIEEVVSNEDNEDIFNENAAIQNVENRNDIVDEHFQTVDQTQSSQPVRKIPQKR